jgi:hypothetical protein
LTAWAVVGLLVLGAGMLGRNWRLPSPESTDRQQPLPAAPAKRVFPRSLVEAWVAAIGVLVVFLAAIHAAADPESPWWSGRAILAVSLAAGILAMWLRRPAYVFVSGLLLNVIGTIAWLAWQEPLTFAGLLQANVLCLAVGSAVWSVVGRAHLEGAPHAVFEARLWPFAHLAAQAALGLLGLVVALSVGSELLDLRHVAIARLDWVALLATGAAVALCLWDASARFPLAGLYALGLMAILLARCASDFPPREYLWTISCELGGFALVAAAVGWLLPQLRPAARALAVPLETEAGDRRWSADWFPVAQTILGGLVAVMATWISLDRRLDGMAEGRALFGLAGRLAGWPAALMLLGTAILMAWQTRDTRRRAWQYAAFASGVLLSCALGWALLASASAAYWLHASVNLMVAAAMITVLAGVGLAKILPGAGDWIDAGRRATPAFALLALGALGAVLVQEGLLFDFGQGAPVAWQEIGVVNLCIVAF